MVQDEIRDPGADEVRIRILASGVAFADVLMRRGLYSGVPSLPHFSRVRHRRHGRKEETARSVSRGSLAIAALPGGNRS
jgi:hypothetical protein